MSFGVHYALHMLPAETAHRFAISAMESAGHRPGVLRFLRDRYAFESPKLETTAFGLRFPNPVGIAAGFDKDGRAVSALDSLGFGFIEVGTVTPLAQPGNEGPRLARLPVHRALVNRLGFPSEGAEAVAERLRATRPRVPMGVNVGRNKATAVERSVHDYVDALRILYDCGDYFVGNISSPNTPGLRDLHRRDLLDELLGTLRAEIEKLAAARGGAPKPVLLKVSPDLSAENLETVAQSVLANGVAGVIIANTTVNSKLVAEARIGGGGLSGPPILDLVVSVVREFYRRVGAKIPLIGVGGVHSADSAYRMIRAGATLVQVYTGFVYEGLGLPGRMCRGLAERLDRDGLPNVAAAVGRDA
jgi:dihydroorotate dehydrogenase